MPVTDDMEIPEEGVVVTSTYTNRPWALIGLAVALVMSVLFSSFLLLGQSGLRDELAAQQKTIDSIYDGEYDFSNALVDEGTPEIVRQSIRDTVFRYADAEGAYVGSFVVTAIVISEDYVLVPAFVITIAENPDVQIIAAGMQSSALDADSGVEELDLSEQPLIDQSLGLAAVRRPAETVLDVVPLLDTLGDVRELQIDSTLLSVGTVPISTQAPGEYGVQVTQYSKFDLIGGSRLIARDITAFQPVYALRDGQPEFIGISIEGSNGVVPIVTIYELEAFFTQLGIQVTFPE